MKKNRKRVNRKVSRPAGESTLKARLTSMFKDGLQIAAGAGAAALFTYKVYDAYSAIDSRIQSSIGRGIAKGALGVGTAVALMSVWPQMPLVAAGIAGYALFLGGMDIFGLHRELPSSTITYPANFANEEARAAFLRANPTADRARVAAIPLATPPAAPPSTPPAAPTGTPPANRAMNPFGFYR